MTRLRLAFALLLATFLSLSAPSADAQEKSWVGKTILMKKPATKFGFTDDKGKPVIHGELNQPFYQVLSDDGGWLRVSQNGKAGWFDKTEAVLADEAAAFFTGRIKLNAKDAGAYTSRATALMLKGDIAGALKDYDDVIRLDPKNTEAYANSAWLLATSPDAKVRNGKKAVELAKKLCELSEWKKPNYIGTLAAACAEAGDFDAAVKYQEQALEDVDYVVHWGGEALKWLALYIEKKPYHQE